MIKYDRDVDVDDQQAVRHGSTLVGQALDDGGGGPQLSFL